MNLENTVERTCEQHLTLSKIGTCKLTLIIRKEYIMRKEDLEKITFTGHTE